ncbi:MAG: VWA domain-containing protein [Acidobacteriia bacterium]|nr:VWA domain-containing protein [Terriglobia bacterium]
MYFLNLSLVQFLTLFGAVSVTMVLLYLLGRSRRKQVVATLRFWVASEQPPAVHKRKRIQQPLSLILQLVSMLLLLLAIAQLRFGAPMATPRDHVLILDTSAWMSAANGSRTLMDEAREKAMAYVRTVPASEHVMLVRADALTLPATAFESNRAKLEQAIARSTPGATALNIEQALAFARQAQALGSGRPGEIVYVGPGRVTAESRLISAPLPKNLRVLETSDATDNCGLRKIGVRRSAADPEVWDIYASVRNYGTAPKSLTLVLRFGGTPAGGHRFTVPPGSEREIAFAWRTRAAGLLEATLLPHDRFPEDDHAILELPPLPSLNLTVYSNEPDLLRPAVTAIPHVNATFRRVEEYRAEATNGLVILDRFRPPQPPKGDAIWIDPPAGASPIPVRTRLEGAPFDHWCSDDALCAGLRAKDLRLGSTYVFESAPDDIKIGQVREGPVIVARAGKNKTVVFGFHPGLSDLRYELATPLLFGNILRWMAPELFRRSAVAAGSAGTVTMQLDPDIRPEGVRVLQQDGSPVPFTTRGRTLRFFSGTPGTVRVLAAERETVYSLTLPELWDSKWEVPGGARRGLPVFRETASLSRDLWQVLAVLGGLGLLLEWLLFGRAEGRVRRLAARPAILRRPGVRKAS